MDTLPSGTVVVANGATGLWASAAAWTLAEDLRIGSVEGDDAAAFGRVGDIAVDRAGRIYVLDRQAQQVRVFGPDGAYLRTVGRKGGGPGEFTGADHLHVDDSLRLWVSDRQARRFSAFDSAGALLGDSPRPGPGFSPNFVGGDAAGSLWDWWWIYDAPNELSRKDLLRFGGSGYRDTLSLPAFGETQWQLVRRQGGGTSIMNFLVPYTASELLAVDPAGGIWRAVSSDYRLTHFATTGDSTRVVQRAFTPLPLSAADRNRALRLARSLAKEGGDADESLIPATKPPLHSILLDDVGYLWAALSPPDDSATVSFDVFDRAGRYLGAVPSPLKVPSLSPTPTVRGSALSYVTRDSLDVQYIVRMRIVGR